MAVNASIVIDNIKDTMVNVMEGINTDMAAALDRIAAEPSNTAAMFELQHEMQRWSIGLTMQSNVVKTLGDTVKGVLNNIK